jgi:D-inositol-3-phosphate glycosyltransferase
VKILLVCTYFPPHIGGLEVVVQQQAESLANAGHDVRVLTTLHDLSLPQEESLQGYTVIRVHANNMIERRTEVPFPLIGSRYIRRLWVEVQAADIVHIHDVLYTPCCAAALITKMKRRKLLVTSHVTVVDHDSRLVVAVQKFLYQIIGRWVWRQASAVVIYNKRVREFLKSHRVKDAKVVEVPNGIDLNIFSPAEPDYRDELRRKYNIGEGKKVVLFVGRLVPKKGYRELIQAAEASYEVLLVGSGQPPSNLASHVRYIGPVAREQLAQLYQLADVFVLPSIGEMFTLAMQEAMACGLPIVTTDDIRYAMYGLDRDLVRLVDPSPANLRLAIRDVLSNDLLRKLMSDYSRTFAESMFDWRKNHERVSELYRAD